MKRRALLKSLGSMAGLSASPTIKLLAYEAPQTLGIFVDQVGYLPGRAKAATVSGASGGTAFRVHVAGLDAAVFDGQLTEAVLGPTSGDRVSQAVFSQVKTPGVYRLEVAGRMSDPFATRPDVYKESLRLTMRSYYGQRCGCAVDLGGGYRHPACHADGAFHVSSGKSGKAPGTLPNRGGWHDAGDYGRYVVNSGITTGTLLWAWEMYPGALRSLALSIPESGGKLPDFLAEIRWNLDWMLSMQDADGGVWHKQTSERFCAFIMPEADRLTSYVIGTGSAPYKSTAATADLAAVAAIAARCYAPYDPAYAQSCVAAARRAYTWALANPATIFKNPAGVGTGEYGDDTVSDELLWAAAELWRTTGEATFEKQFLAAALPSLAQLHIDAPGWGNVASMAYWTYAMDERKGSAEVRDRIRAQTVVAANALIAKAATSGYGHTLDAREFGWGSNSVAANQSLLLLMADRFVPADSSVDAALGNLHYLLGRNCHGVSWVTGLGARPFQHPHHRPSAADGIAEPWPGLLSGGPNARPGDPVARRLPSAAPMRMWVDDQGAYSMNEVAINWNAPLVFLLAAANSL